MFKGLSVSLLIFIVSLIGVTTLSLYPRSNDRISGVMFSSSMAGHDALLAVAMAGGQPVTTAFSGRIIIVGNTSPDFRRKVKNLGALFQFRTLGAWGCSPNTQQPPLIKEDA